MQYKNPIIFSDYSDPDVIRVGEDFYMVCSSFNYTPSVPVLHSKNLVEWELINYVMDELPFKKFDKVRSGDGAWAPSIRYRRGTFYCLIPFPDDGIYVCQTDNIRGKWSAPRRLICGKGIIDPCPIWTDGKCYVAVAFAKSRVGFNSVIGLYEVDEKLTRQISQSYKIIYDGHDNNPTIEGPKFYKHGEYFYILAPAGSVKSGWQVALRSKNIFGEYQSKVILMQNDSPVNGPHQGALIDLLDDKWAFIHFQDMGAYGRILHLQPAAWVDDWVLCGEVKDSRIAGTPVKCGNYPVEINTGYSLPESDNFNGDKLSLMWQTPTNKGEGWYSLNGGLQLNCVASPLNLSETPNVFTAKITRLNFLAETYLTLSLQAEGDEAGLVVLGQSYCYVCAVRRGGRNYIELREGNSNCERVISSRQIFGESVIIKVEATNRDIYNLVCSFSVDGKRLLNADGGTYSFNAEAGKWVGAKMGIFARNTQSAASMGFAVFKYYKVQCI
jgi:beta-xylosidase